MHRLTRDPQQGGQNRWAAVPLGATVCAGFDEVTNQILSYEMSLDEEIELTGPLTLSLRFSANEIDSHVVARTGVVSRDGAHRILSMGAIRPACRRIDRTRSTATEIAIDIDEPAPLVPHTPVRLVFSRTPQPVVLKPGERLRLDVASRTDLLRSDPSHGHAQFDMQVPPYFSRNTIHYGPDTYLEVWTMGVHRGGAGGDAAARA